MAICESEYGEVHAPEMSFLITDWRHQASLGAKSELHRSCQTYFYHWKTTSLILIHASLLSLLQSLGLTVTSLEPWASSIASRLYEFQITSHLDLDTECSTTSWRSLITTMAAEQLAWSAGTKRLMSCSKNDDRGGKLPSPHTHSLLDRLISSVPTW